jgi:hypothetical protein
LSGIASRTKCSARRQSIGKSSGERRAWRIGSAARAAWACGASRRLAQTASTAREHLGDDVKGSIGVSSSRRAGGGHRAIGIRHIRLISSGQASAWRHRVNVVNRGGASGDARRQQKYRASGNKKAASAPWRSIRMPRSARLFAACVLALPLRIARPRCARIAAVPRMPGCTLACGLSAWRRRIIAASLAASAWAKAADNRRMAAESCGGDSAAAKSSTAVSVAAKTASLAENSKEPAA